MYYAFMMSSEFKRIRSSLGEAMASESNFVSNIIESGNAEKSFEKEILKNLWFLYPLSLMLGKALFFELFAHKSKIFQKLMDCLKSVSDYDRQRFFRSSLESYSGFKNKSVPLCTWLDEFEKKSGSVKYCKDTMYVIMCLIEEEFLLNNSANNSEQEMQTVKVSKDLMNLHKENEIHNFLNIQSKKGD